MFTQEFGGGEDSEKMQQFITPCRGRPAWSMSVGIVIFARADAKPNN